MCVRLFEGGHAHIRTHSMPIYIYACVYAYGCLYICINAHTAYIQIYTCVFLPMCTCTFVEGNRRTGERLIHVYDVACDFGVDGCDISDRLLGLYNLFIKLSVTVKIGSELLCA